MAAEYGIPVFAVALGTPEGTVRNVDVLGNVQTVRVPPDRETLKLIAERTGGQRVRWNQGSEADSTVADEVRSLLADELAAERGEACLRLARVALERLSDGIGIMCQHRFFGFSRVFRRAIAN